MGRRRLLVLLLAATVGVLQAEDLQIWNSTEFTALQTTRWKVEGFGVLRARDHMSAVYDRRVGSLIRFSLGRHLSLGGGYLRRWTDSNGTGISGQNRFFFGPTVTMRGNGAVVEWVSLAEHHRVGSEPPFMRYKQRVEIQRPRSGWSPFISQEVAFRKEGVTRLRSTVGLRKKFHSDRKFEFGYQFETLRSGQAWVPRHSIRTALSVGSLFGRHR